MVNKTPTLQLFEDYLIFCIPLKKGYIRYLCICMMVNMGYFVLQGGSEFNGRMRSSDLKAMALAGGMDARISIIPAAAAPDNNHQSAGQLGEARS